ncbi:MULTISPECIES: nucleotidyltransferase family protein [Sphingomonadaceae]|uniref:nucleotidyltransferase family protein n=1 Tax=Sphingomonadaceae TaxID=41297 RepID=UPI001158C06D|nr:MULTISPECIES: nucleotidyltransferase family protein [Sphingomonadaceae]QDK34204.1 GTP--adenosylcobinamide-phosphate guanylyltransferase [Sphingomonas sp. IC081]QSR16986.1 GTP--adenosylcobinamide-phosphate guanylyltransferase [Novosphingobium sp. KA1]
MISPAPVLPAALILAGSRPGAPDPVAAAEGLSHKALVGIAGKPMLAHVVAALRDAGAERIAVVANDPAVIALAETLGCEVLPAAAGPSASVAAGFAALGAPMLVTTSDHALLRGEWVRDFLQDTPEDADVAVLLAERGRIEAAMPGSKRTYLRFADGQWSGCNLFLLKTAQAAKAIETWKLVEADRKRPWRIAARLGIGILLGYALGRLTLAAALARLGSKIGVKARLVAARDGLAAVDVDKPSDLVDARAILGRR